MPRGVRRFGPTEFAVYIAAFNCDDFSTYGQFYHPTVRMRFSGRIELNGREAVRDFYAAAHRRLRQTISINHAIGDRHALHADITGDMLALVDWLDFSAASLRQGDRLISSSLACYRLREGLIVEVVTARYALQHIHNPNTCSALV